MALATYTIEELIAHKESGAVSAELIEKLHREADEIIEKPLLRVVDIKLPRPSGDPHDYVSIGPYWWPNPDTPDGLPYVRRDGILTPLANDPVTHEKLCKDIFNLSIAAYYFDENEKLTDYFENRIDT